LSTGIYICVYIYLYIYMYVCKCTYIYLYMYVLTCRYIYTQNYTYMCIFALSYCDKELVHRTHALMYIYMNSQKKIHINYEAYYIKTQNHGELVLDTIQP